MAGELFFWEEAALVADGLAALGGRVDGMLCPPATLIAALAREAGLKEFTAEVLPDNTPMLKVFERSGLKFSSKRSADGIHAVLQL